MDRFGAQYRFELEPSDSPDGDFSPTIIVQGGVYRNVLRGSLSCDKYRNKLNESVITGYYILKDNGTAVEAVEKAVSVLEDSEFFQAGYVSPLNENIGVEYHAMIIDEHTLKTGAVITGRHFKNPKPKDLKSGSDPSRFEQFIDNCYRGHDEQRDSVCAIAVDSKGRLACVLSSGGIWKKIKGHVGDVPFAGCGGYANDKGAAATTGHEMLPCEAPYAECITSLPGVIKTKKDVPEMSSKIDVSKIYSDVEDSDDDDFDPKFTGGFLDDYFRIRKDVTEKLKQFSWINGYCGITFNPEPRLYVTVVKERENYEDSLKNEIDDKFGWKASDYVEFRYAESSFPTLQYLSNLKVKDNAGPSPLRADDEDRGSFGKVTMFCRKDSQDYVLSCAHVACISDLRETQEIGHGAENIDDMINILKMKKENPESPIGNNYFFISPSGRNVSLGRQFDYKFDSDKDIMSIRVNGGVINEDNLHCSLVDIIIARHQKREPIRKKVWRQVKRRKAKVTTHLQNKTGLIEDPDHSCVMPGKIHFENAIKVKSDDIFLCNGDSGVLVFFYDEKTKQNVPLAYGVLEESNEESSKKYVCLYLDTALEALDKGNCDWYKICGPY